MIASKPTPSIISFVNCVSMNRKADEENAIANIRMNKTLCLSSKHLLSSHWSIAGPIWRFSISSLRNLGEVRA